MRKILIAEDTKIISLQLQKILLELNEEEVFTTQTTDETFNFLSTKDQELDLLLLSDSLVAGDNITSSLELVKKIIEINPTCKIVIITTHENKQNILKFISNGAKEYIEKPLSIEKIKKLFSDLSI